MKYVSLRLVTLLLLSLAAQTNAFVNGPPLRRGLSPFLVVRNSNNAKEEDDLFDPLLSPHAYPNGVDAGPVRTQDEEEEGSFFTTTTSSGVPKTKKPFGFRIYKNPDHVQPSQSLNLQQPPPPPIQPDFFDPTLSPHQYPQGAPDTVDYLATPPATTTNHKIGIILMDHGSRNPKSNQRLQDLAQLYQSRLTTSSSSTTIVRAAHMEIAEPSIPHVLRQLIVEDQVDQVICHPYFLSPGRHVTQDIPEILQQAMDDLRQELAGNPLPPIVTTDPVGAQTDVMIAAMHNLVQQAATVPLSRR